MASPIRDGLVPWPDAFVQRYVDAGYWRGNPLGALIRQVADRTPDAVALIDGDLRLTYAELVDRADAAASRLVDEVGLRPGDRLIVQLPNTWQFVVLTLACLRSGIVPVMALPAHRRAELSYLADLAEAVAIAVPDRWREFDHQALAAQVAANAAELRQVLVAGPDVADGHHDLDRLLSVPVEATADRARWDAAQPGSRDVAVFLLSGGTTGLPKLIARTHDDYAYNALASAAVSGF